MAENPNTHDPEYNTEAIHSDADDPWFEQEEPADETYHPHDELAVHDYAPQERERVIGSVPAYTPRVNTGGSYEPDPHDPSPEPDSLHIVTYGTVEDVAFADGDESRRNGLVSMSVRDEMDDLIHTDFHTLNPLSLLAEQNVKIGDRVRVDIQDYKNVVEWFVYNYPTVLQVADLLKVRQSDGPWFEEDMQTTLAGETVDTYGRKVKGGSISSEPQLFNPQSGYEDWEHQQSGSQLDKSYLEIGQRDGNKKITMRQFLQLIDDYFHITDMWATLREHEKRLVHLERDVREEDSKRNTRIVKTIDGSMYELLNQYTTNPDWMDPTASQYGHPSYFIGNLEQKQFSLFVNYRTAMHEDSWAGAEDWFYAFRDHQKGGRYANPLFKEGTIPEEFRPTQFRWLVNYGYAETTIGGWWDVISRRYPVDIGIDPDGSVWVAQDDLTHAAVSRSSAGIFGTNGYQDHMDLLGCVKNPSLANPNKVRWQIEVTIATFGGNITIGESGTEW